MREIKQCQIILFFFYFYCILMTRSIFWFYIFKNIFKKKTWVDVIFTYKSIVHLVKILHPIKFCRMLILIRGLTIIDKQMNQAGHYVHLVWYNLQSSVRAGNFWCPHLSGSKSNHHLILTALRDESLVSFWDWSATATLWCSCMSWPLKLHSSTWIHEITNNYPRC